jgi:hypothetical protein
MEFREDGYANQQLVCWIVQQLSLAMATKLGIVGASDCDKQTAVNVLVELQGLMNNISDEDWRCLCDTGLANIAQAKGTLN